MDTQALVAEQLGVLLDVYELPIQHVTYMEGLAIKKRQAKSQS